MMKRLRGLFCFAWIGLMLLVTAGQAQIPPDLVLRGKMATALVEVGDGKAYGSAFCIHASGLFVTNAHVVDAAGEGAACSLVLHPGEKGQQKVPARVVRIHKEADLALLQIESKAPLSTLELADSDVLIETQEVVAFGFPFGTDLAGGHGEYPSVTVTTGHITALRKTEGVLSAIQMDAAVHPGNSGGPILNAKGQVVGIVVAKFTKAEGINFAIPVNHLQALLHKTEILFTPPAIPPARRHEKQDFVIQIATFAPSPAPYQVEFQLTTGDGPTRTFTAQTTDGRTFHVSAVPVPADSGAAAAPLRLTIQEGKNELVCHVKDRSFTVAGQTVRLSQVQEIRLSPLPSVLLTDGKLLEGTVGNLGDAEAEVAGNKFALHLNKSTRIEVDDEANILPTVAYHIVVRRQGQVAAESNGVLALIPAAGAVPPPAVALQGNNALRFEEAHTYKVPAAGDVVLAADLDGDRYPDVVIGGGNEIGVLYNHRDGTL
ncbi:MAG TPA: trypsin-like peptidase domain-containing protein, partial [Chthonomonadaceae bacterium]|nr:trypsin-like peptidase domain-containing protein [Chthonomonadaceae bacterium]